MGQENAKNSKLISTSAVAKQLDVPAKSVFELLKNSGWIERYNDNWKLTGKGEFEGGEYVSSSKYGEFVGWPAEIVEHRIFSALFNQPLKTEVLSSEVKMSQYRFNAILGEIGWQKKFHRGWRLTDKGQKAGGVQDEDHQSGVPYTRWRRTIFDNNELNAVLQLIFSGRKAVNQHTQQTASENVKTDPEGQIAMDFEAIASDAITPDKPMLTISGYLATSAEDFIVDNWLYLMGVNRAYQRKLPIDELGVCDFYLPDAHLYIEVWHQHDKEHSLSQKLQRLDWYKSENQAYIEIQTQEIMQLDTLLPKRLLKQGITVF